MRILGTLSALLLVLAVSCKKEEAKAPPKKDPGKTPDAGKAVPAPVPDAMAAEPVPEEGALLGKGKMQHCPSAVEGSTTVVANSKDGVVVTVTAKDPKDKKAVDDIRARAKHVAEAAKKDPAEVKHTGDGEGGGGGGQCPVVLKDSTITVKDTAGGSVITVVATDAKNLGWLQTEAKARADRLAAAPPAAPAPAPAPEVAPEKAPTDGKK